MQNLVNIFLEALVLTRKRIAWWVLAAAQLFALFAIIHFARRLALGFAPWSYLLTGVIIFSPVTLVMWLEMQSAHSRKAIEIKLAAFVRRVTVGVVVCLAATSASVLLRKIPNAWIFIVLLSSLVSGTAALALLFAFLLGQDFIKSWLLAFDAWRKKNSLAAIFSFVLLICHAVSFALATSLWPQLKAAGGFSVFPTSATIWVPMLVLAGLLSFLAAWMNCFLVILFLDSVAPEKEVLVPALKPVILPQAHQ